MPPDHPYPAALEDAMRIWKAATKMADPKNMAIFGSSAGGALTLSMIHIGRLATRRLPAGARKWSRAGRSIGVRHYMAGGDHGRAEPV